jgi:hypothetical protein
MVVDRGVEHFERATGLGREYGAFGDALGPVGGEVDEDLAANAVSLRDVADF